MKLVVYDSYFGNTQEVANIIAKVLKAKAVHVKEEPNIRSVRLLVVGSPTRAFRPTPAIKAWIRGLGSLEGVSVAAYDTRIALEDSPNKFLSAMMKLFGWAAIDIEKMLVKKGGTLLVGAQGFAVRDTKGPLKKGEIQRVQAWAQQLLSTVQ